MEQSRKDGQILQHIVRYCDEVSMTVRFLHADQEKLAADFITRNAVCMPLEQIGELANHFSQEFLAAHREIPWREVIGMRNILAHDYGSCDVEMVWATVETDIPALRAYCAGLLREAGLPLPEVGTGAPGR